MGKIPSAQFQLRFLQDIQRLLAEGQFTATYKFALLMALADVSVEKGRDDDSMLTIGVGDLSEKFITYYWKQAAIYHESVLQQNNGKQAAVISSLSDTRERYGTLGSLRSNPAQWSRLVARVGRVIKNQPLWKLQTVGDSSFDFLYPNEGAGNSIELRTGIAYCFRVFYPLIADLVQANWIAFVRRLPGNQDVLGKQGDLPAFMFGSERASLKRYKEVLTEIQSGTCFYCRRRRPDDTLEVDHFIPWSFYQLDLGHNFVLSCRPCNGDKSAKLAGVGHLERWVFRNRDDVYEIALNQNQLLHDLRTSNKVAEFAYSRAELTGAQTWIKRRNVLREIEPGWRSVLGVG